MILRIFAILIFILTFFQINYSQCNNDILGSSLIVRKQNAKPYSLSDIELEADKISKTLKCYQSTIDLRTKARMAFLVANRYYYLESIDSSEHYLNSSYNANSTWFCKNLEYQYISVECSDYVLENIGSFFLMDMNVSDFYIAKCNLDTLALKEEAARRQFANSQKEIPHYLQRIFERDQEERLKDRADFDLQGVLDEENRIELDVLLEQNKIQFTDESLDIVWFVVQHSTDCNWTMKWFEILLDKMVDKQYKGNYLQFTFERFFDKNKGYCIDKSESETIKYLKRIRQKFSDARIQKIISKRKSK